MRVLARLLVVALSFAATIDPSPVFPVPSWKDGAKHLRPAFDTIEGELQALIANSKYDAASFSIAVTSNTETLWHTFHTARRRNESRPGTTEVDGDSLYRIASITKTFTVLGVLYQYQAEKLELDAPIKKYIPELAGDLPWDDITLRALASQLSGIPREFAQSDLVNSFPEPWKIGLPPASRDGLPMCDEYHDFHPPCGPKDLIEALKSCQPVFAPNQQSTYSNLNFELLGIALERATGTSYKDYMQTAIFDPLNMSLTTLDKPSDQHAVLPLGDNYWDIDEGVQNPTGGIYSSTNDMSKFLRYVLTHYNAIATGINWFVPASWSNGLQNFYGMPWEIFRAVYTIGNPEHFSNRVVTFITKGGGLPGYVSKITMMPEYGLGVTVLVGCQTDCGELLNAIQEIVTTGLVFAAEEQIWKDIERKYDGRYIAVDSSLNSSLVLSSSSEKGLVITEFVSNSTDVLNSVLTDLYVDASRPWKFQLLPTMLFKNESAQQGEIWRAIAVYERDWDRGRWDQASNTDIDVGLYAGRSLNEIVFWHEEGIVEMPGWRLKMKSARHSSHCETLMVQE